MPSSIPRILLLLLTVTLAWLGDTPAEKPRKLRDEAPLQVLLVTGGCCHNYLFQSLALTTGVEKRIHAEFTVLNEGGTGTRGQIALYDDPDWAKPYDVVIHNECFADTDGPRIHQENHLYASRGDTGRGHPLRHAHLSGRQDR